MVQAQLAIAKTWLEAYSRLGKKEQKRVREFIEKFRADPTSRGLNFEKLPGMRDSKVRSLRVDQTYRVIVVQPDRGDVILCVWVDHHDEAYRWAERKVFEVNPLSGVLQVYSVEEGQQVGDEEVDAPVPEVEAPSKAAQADLLLTHVDDEELLMSGVPAPSADWRQSPTWISSRRTCQMTLRTCCTCLRPAATS